MEGSCAVLETPGLSLSTLPLFCWSSLSDILALLHLPIGAMVILGMTAPPPETELGGIEGKGVEQPLGGIGMSGSFCCCTRPDFEAIEFAVALDSRAASS